MSWIIRMLGYPTAFDYRPGPFAICFLYFFLCVLKELEIAIHTHEQRDNECDIKAALSFIISTRSC